MKDTYPYVLNNGKIGALLQAVGDAAKPPRFSYEFLKNIGFPSSNDRAFVSLFRHLGFISENNVPTQIFDEIRDPTKRPYALGEAIKQAYADLFAINTNIHRATDADIKAAISRVSGKDADYTSRAFNTFKSLLNLAKFDGNVEKKVVDAKVESPAAEEVATVVVNGPAAPAPGPLSLNYNIEIHLPATTDISVYNAIFRSMRETLGVG